MKAKFSFGNVVKNLKVDEYSKNCKNGYKEKVLVKEPPFKKNFTFKAPAVNLEFIDKGTKNEIRPIKVPKHEKLYKEIKF